MHTATQTTKPRPVIGKLVQAPVQQGFTQSKFWNLYIHGLTASAIDKWEDCREQFRLVYIEGWSSHNVSMAIEFGTCVHWVLEQVYGAKTTEFPTPKAIQILVGDYQKHWETLVPAPTQTQLDQQEMVYALAEATLPTYFRRYDGDVTGKYTHKLEGVFAPKKWIKLEETFCYPYKMPDGRIIPLRGKKDATFLNNRDELVVFDTKTKGQIVEDTIATLLQVDFQIMLYMWTELQEAKAKNEPIPKYGQWNIYRRPQLRQRKDENIADFALRVKDDCSSLDRYDHYFTRIQVGVTQAELKHWHDTQLLPQLLEIQMWNDGIIPHRSRPKNLAKYGKLTELAEMILNGSPVGLYKRKLVFPELSDAQF